MKTTIISIFGIASALSFSSCAEMGPNAQRGALTGAGVGAAAGGILGHQSGRGLEGAALGAALGGGAGAVYGDNKDKQNYR